MTFGHRETFSFREPLTGAQIAALVQSVANQRNEDSFRLFPRSGGTVTFGQGSELKSREVRLVPTQGSGSNLNLTARYTSVAIESYKWPVAGTEITVAETKSSYVRDFEDFVTRFTRAYEEALVKGFPELQAR